jgi:hypothetical protein
VGWDETMLAFSQAIALLQGMANVCVQLTLLLLLLLLLLQVTLMTAATGVSCCAPGGAMTWWMTVPATKR